MSRWIRDGLSGSSTFPSCRRFFGRGRPLCSRSRSRGRAPFPAPFSGGLLVLRLSASRSTLLAAARDLVHRCPGPLLRLLLRHPTAFIDLLNVLGLSLLFIRVAGFISSRHGDQDGFDDQIVPRHRLGCHFLGTPTLHHASDKRWTRRISAAAPSDESVTGITRATCHP